MASSTGDEPQASNNGSTAGRPLLSANPQSYGEHYRPHLLEQYKLFVSSSIKVTEWRTAANTFLLATNTLLVTAFGLGQSLIDGNAWRYAVALVGLVMSATWWTLIRSYKALNRAKFAVIHELEAELPAALFDREWQLLKEQRGYERLTAVEQFVPIVFGLLYVLLCVLSVCGVTSKPVP